MAEGRITTYPKVKTKIEPLKTKLTDGNVVKADLEYVQKDIKLAELSYSVFVGTTPGKKGLPNQDYAGLSQNKLTIAGKVYGCVLVACADGVSTRPGSEETSKSIVDNVVSEFASLKSIKTFNELESKLWNSIAQGAKNSKIKTGLTTVTVALLAAKGAKTKLIVVNCGDSRAYWAGSFYVETARIHTAVNKTGTISNSVGAERKITESLKDSYYVDDDIQLVYLCTDGMSHNFGGFWFPTNMFPLFGKQLGAVHDHLTAISVRRKI